MVVAPAFFEMLERVEEQLYDSEVLGLVTVVDLVLMPKRKVISNILSTSVLYQDFYVLAGMAACVV